MMMSTGEQLRQAREARSVSLDEIAHATHIRLRYLEALEVGDYETLPSPVQARGFIRAYAGYLKMDPEPLLQAMAGELPPSVDHTPPAPPAPGNGNSLPGNQAVAIFHEIGQKLRTQRDLLGLSLEDVEKHTHLRSHYLNALESGDLDHLPSPVQGRGMLNNYAIFLGFDPEPLLLRFADGLQARLAARQATRPLPQRTGSKLPPAMPSPFRRLFSADLLLAGFLIVFLLGFMGWAALRISDMQASQAPTNTAPSIADVLLGVPGITPSPSPSPEVASEVEQADASLPPEEQADSTLSAEQATPTGLLPAFSGSALQVYIVVRQSAWMRVTVDDKIEFEGRTLPGSAHMFSGNERVEILTGNGAALQVFYNQQDLGTMGIYGETINRIYTLEGVQTPTATATTVGLPPPTSTPTPQVTPSLSPTAAP